MAPSIRSLLIGLLPFVAAQGCPYASIDKRDLLVARGDEPSLTTLETSFGKCPTISDQAGAGTRSRDWWPCQLKLDVLRQFSPEQNPLGGTFDYATAFATLDCKFLLRELTRQMQRT
jgi:catalase-peroxidase